MRAPFFLNANRARVRWYGLSRDPKQFDDAPRALLARLASQYERIWFAYDGNAAHLPNPVLDGLDAALQLDAEYDFEDGVQLIFVRNRFASVKYFLRRDGVVLIVYLLLSIILTYPLITHFDSHVPGRGIDDPALAWNLWWVKFSIFNLETSPLYTDYLYYPLGVNLTANTSTFLNGILALPFTFLFGTIVANNLIILFALVCGAYGTFLLAREVLARCGVRSDFCALLAGATFSFGAWHINYVSAGHPMLLSSEWIPFFALYLIRSDRAGWRNGVHAGWFFSLSAWTELTFIPFMAMLAILYGIYFLIANRIRWQRGGKESMCSAWRNWFWLGIVSIVSVSPLLWSLFADSLRYGYYIAPGLGRAQVFSAEPISFFVPSAAHPILGEWANGLTNANTSYAFIGYAVLILAMLGFVGFRKLNDAKFWLIAAIFFVLVMLGPTLLIDEQNTGIAMPFALLQKLPFVNANRYPVRYNTMMMLALAPLVALGAARLIQMQRRVVLGGLTLLMCIEQLAFPIALTDLRAPAIFQSLRREPGDFTVMDLPLGWRDSVAILGKLDYRAQFLQTIHEKRLIGGLVSRHPAFKFQYFVELPVINSLIALQNGNEIDEARRAQDQTLAPEVLRFFNVRYVAATRALTTPAVLDYVLALFPLTEVYHDDERIVYQVASLPPLRTIHPADETARLYFDDGWGRVQWHADVAYRWATRGDAKIWLPLESRDQVVAFQMRGANRRQRLTVYVNDKPLDPFVLTDMWSEYRVAISATALRDGLNEIVFVTETFPIGATSHDDYAIGGTGVTSPVDLAVAGAGFDAGKFGEIFVAGRNRIPNKRGYHLVAVNPQTGAVERAGSFDTFADANESARLAQFIAGLPRGEIVAGVAIDDVSKNLQQSAIDALRSIGVETDLRFQFRMGHAFIGVKGAEPGLALERVDGRFPANVSVGKNVASDRAAFMLGEITIGE